MIIIHVIENECHETSAGDIFFIKYSSMDLKFSVRQRKKQSQFI